MSHERSRRESIRQALDGERGDHPPYEMIEHFVDGTGDEVTKEIVSSHREVCATCDAEVRDLMSFSGRAPAIGLLRWLGAVAAVIAVVIAGAYLMRRRSTDRAEKPPARVTAPRTVAASGYGRADWDTAVRAAIERGSIQRPAILNDVRPKPDVLRTPEGTSTMATMTPAGVVIDNTTPTLTWRAAPGDSVVSVFDGFERVAQSGLLQSTEWRVTTPLARGRTYTWQVEIRRGASAELLPSPPAPAAVFHVLGDHDSATLAEARRRFPNDHLLLGVLHARLGMQQQAVDELRTYAAQHPDVRNAAALADAVARW